MHSCNSLRHGLACIVLLAACSSDDSADTVDWDESSKVTLAGAAAPYTWRSKPCVPHADGFAPPELAKPRGALRLDLSADMQPVGFDETIELSVRSASGAEIDSTAEGEFEFESEPPVELVESTALMQGAASLRIRFLQPGVHRLSVVLRDDSSREGSVEVLAYETQLPVWEMAADSADLAEVFAEPNKRIERAASLTIDGQSYDTTVRLHGGSSRGFPKPSFRFDVLNGSTLPDGSRHLVLRAEYRDPSLLRNFLAAELFSSAGSIAVSRSELVHLRVNARYAGVRWHVERIDDDFLRARGLDPSGSLYEADPPAERALPGANLTELPTIQDYRVVYPLQSGKRNHADLIELIEEVLAADAERFVRDVQRHVEVDWFLRYMAVMAAIQNQDHIRKNYYLYRDADDPTLPRWLIFPWDLDLSFGHLWSEENDILEETVMADASVYVGRRTGHSHFNQLMSRLWERAVFDQRFWFHLRALMQTAFDPALIQTQIDDVLCRATPDILADSWKRSSNASFLQNVAELTDFVTQRRASILDQDPEPPPGR
jgi:spore coat protein H